MGLVLWIDRNTFATSLVEKVFKKKNLGFYSLPHAKDFAYLVEDLRPDLLVLDEATITADLEAFKNQYSQGMKSLPVVMIDPKVGVDFLENKIGEIHRPFDPFQIPGILENFLKKN